MANKSYTAIHRILKKASPITYIEPGTAFTMDAVQGDKLVALGAAKPKGDAAAPSKAPSKAKTSDKKADESGEDGLV